MKVKEIKFAGIQFISEAKQAKWIPLNFYIIPFLAPSTSSFTAFSACEEVPDIKLTIFPDKRLWRERHKVAHRGPAGKTPDRFYANR